MAVIRCTKCRLEFETAAAAGEHVCPLYRDREDELDALFIEGIGLGARIKAEIGGEGLG